MYPQEIVYSDTWHLSLERQPNAPTQPAPQPGSHESPFRCDFGEFDAPLIDWRTREIDKKPVRVVIFDDPDFFPLLADADREFLLQIFAYMLVDMIRSGLPRFQYGFSVSVLDEGAISVPMYVEYHATVIKSDLPPDLALPPRYLAKIWRGPPPSKVRRLFSRIR